MKNINTLLSPSVVSFNRQIDREEMALYTLCSKIGTELVITSYGVKIVSLMVPDKSGEMTDTVTDHGLTGEYLTSEKPYFGATCDRYGNHIAAGKFMIDGTTYDKLAINNSPSSLHGKIKGLNVVVWSAKQIGEQTIELKYTSADGEEGFPGELKTIVTYHLANENEVVIPYQASTGKLTVLNLTNHSYFNLSGAGGPYIRDHIFTVNADYYLPTGNTVIPYEPREKIEGIPMDFQTPHEIGGRISDNFKQFMSGKGYDHTHILNKEDSELSYCTRCSFLKTDIVIEIHTTQPGIQLYTGNRTTENLEGKNGQRYSERVTLCLEI